MSHARSNSHGVGGLVESTRLDPEGLSAVNARLPAPRVLRRPARPLPVARDLLDVVHQAVQLPLRRHLGPAAQREAAHALA